MPHEVRPEWAVVGERLGWLEQAQELSGNQVAMGLASTDGDGAAIGWASESFRSHWQASCAVATAAPSIGSISARSTRTRKASNSDWPKRDAPPRTGTGAVAASGKPHRLFGWRVIASLWRAYAGSMVPAR